MRDELEKLIVNAALNGAYEDAGQRVLSTDVISATLTSIINLVDKELPKHKGIETGGWIGYNKAIDDMRAIIRSDNKNKGSE